MNFFDNDKLYNTILHQSTFEDAMEIIMRDYNTELIHHGIGISRSELLKRDKIDLRNIFTYDDKANKFDLPKSISIDIDMTTLCNNHWYCFIPCFSSGVIQINTARYLLYEIKDIDFVKRQYTLCLQLYIFKKLWYVGDKMTVTITFDTLDIAGVEKEKGYAFAYLLETVKFTDYSYEAIREFNQQMPIESLNWSKEKTELWKQYYDKTLIIGKDNYDKKITPFDNSYAYFMLSDFLYYIAISNQILQQHKPKAKRSTGTPAKSKTVINASADTPKRIIREVGPITITSEKPPKPSTRETVIRYKTTTWKTRGGIRHMKDGRKIPFRESIHRRRCLIDENNPNSSIPQSIIKIKGDVKHDKQPAEQPGSSCNKPDSATEPDGPVS